MRMCELLQLSRASYYRHFLHQQPQQAEMELRDAIQKACLTHRFYGYRRVACVVQKQGFAVSAKMVRRIMHSDNLLAVRRRRFVATTDSDRFCVHPNLAQYLELDRPNQLWVADLTYIRLKREFVYLAVVLDAFSRRVIGWQLDRHLKSELALTALNQAIAVRGPMPGLVHHSDRGTQYSCRNYIGRLQSLQAVISMSGPGRPWENAICESFIKTLKREEINGTKYDHMEHLQQCINEFLETIYNPLRLHSALGYVSPAEFESSLTHTNWHPAARLFVPHQEAAE